MWKRLSNKVTAVWYLLSLHGPFQPVKELQRFLGFANFYCKFIQNYSIMTAPLTLLLKGRPKTLSSNPEAECAMQMLKTAFTTAPRLAHSDPEKPFLVEASTSGVGAVLSQQQEKSTPSMCLKLYQLQGVTGHQAHPGGVEALVRGSFTSSGVWTSRSPNHPTQTLLCWGACTHMFPEFIESVHSSKSTGHQGTAQTLLLLQDRYWWPGMAKDTQRYAQGC